MFSSSTNIFCNSGNFTRLYQKKYQSPMSPNLKRSDTVYEILPIAELLDKSLSAGTDFSSPDLRKSDLEGFDIGEFV